jgi:hypothetical protein
MQHPSKSLVFAIGAGAVLAVISAEIAFVGWLMEAPLGVFALAGTTSP